MRMTILTPELWEKFKENARVLDVKEVTIQHPDYTIDKWNFKEVEGSYAAVSDDGNTVYAVGGIQRDECYGNIVWMLCTNAVVERKVEFLRFTKVIYNVFINGNKHMWNYVWLGNKLHVDWLKWLGAEFSATYRINGEPFQRFDFYKVSETNDKE